MFAELCHSFADVFNSMYRLHGVVTAGKMKHTRVDSPNPADDAYGFERQTYFKTHNSLLVLILVGGIYPLQHAMWTFYGIYQGSDYCIEHAGYIYLVFGAAIAFESATGMKAYSELRRMATEAGVTTRTALFDRDAGIDMLSKVTFWESVVGISSAVVGIGGVYLSQVYQTGVFDTMGSVFMASSLLSISSWLYLKNQRLLIGRTLPPTVVDKIIFDLECEDTITAVHDVKTEILGTDTVRFKAEVEWNAEAICRRQHHLSEEHRAFIDNRDPTLKETYDQLEDDTYDKLWNEIKQFQDHDAFKNWFTKNEALLLLTLSKENRRIEAIIRARLSAFETVHVDLEPW